MKKLISSFLTFASAIAILVGSGLFLYNFVLILVRSFSDLKPEYATILATSVSAVVVLGVTKHLDKKAEIQKSIREKKAPTYEGMLDFLLNMIMSEKVKGHPMSESELLSGLHENNKSVIIWGSDEIIVKYAEIRNVGNSGLQGDALAKDMLIKVEEFILLLRKDLGHKNTNIKKGQVLSLFVNDIDAIVNSPVE